MNQDGKFWISFWITVAVTVISMTAIISYYSYVNNKQMIEKGYVHEPPTATDGRWVKKD